MTTTAMTTPMTRRASTNERPLTLSAFVEGEGQAYTSRALTPIEQQVVLAAAALCRQIHGPFEFQQCFVNSQRALMLDASRRLYYVEGYVFDHAIQLHTLHGWLAINDKVIDFTGPPADPRKLPPEPPQILGEFSRREYCGIPFKRAYVRQRARVTGGFGTLIDDWERNFPLFTLDRDVYRRRAPKTVP